MAVIWASRRTRDRSLPGDPLSEVSIDSLWNKSIVFRFTSGGLRRGTVFTVGIHPKSFSTVIAAMVAQDPKAAVKGFASALQKMKFNGGKS